MSIPDYQSIMLPLLTFASDNKQKTKTETHNAMAAHFKLHDADLKKLLPSGKQTLFSNRIGWATTYLKKAGILKSVSRGVFEITERGLDLVKSGIKDLRTKDLTKYPEFNEFQTVTTDDEKSEAKNHEIDDSTPDESFEHIYKKMKSALIFELVEKMKNCTPDFFEQLVVDVIVAMGYGGSLKEAGEAIGRSGDGGVDGIIKEDRLGLDVIYIQAKKWQNNVGEGELRDFVGALEGKKANKGIFITTAGYAGTVSEYIKKINKKIVLIDGKMLADLMVEHNIGVTSEAKYELKKIDNDYFDKE